MPTFKYEAVLPGGQSVFGIHDAESFTSLVDYLGRRQLTLVDHQELSLSSHLTHDFKDLPRVVQLRIGERLREAVMTGLPTHSAVRAVASEPFEHPFLVVMPWLLILTCFCSLVFVFLAIVVPEIRLYSLIIAGVGPVLCLTLWGIAAPLLIVRPRRALFRIADQMEKGQIVDLRAFESMSGEMAAVARSTLDERSKATTLADLAPGTMASQLRSHQLATRILGPMIVCCVMWIGMHLFCLSVIPQMRGTFNGFGVSLNFMTEFTFKVSSFIEFFGYSGFFGMVGLLCSGLAFLYFVLVSPRFAETLSHIPWLGMSARWLLQARISRMLSVLLRNNANPALALRLAANASHSSTAAKEAEKMAGLIEQGSVELADSRVLAGLPLSMLFQASESNAKESDRQQASQSFSLYADALERAASGNGVLIGVIIEMFAITFSGLIIGFVVISLFSPLIMLVNALA